MKKFTTAVILVIMIVTVALLAACSGGAETSEVNLDFDNLGSRPNAEAAAKATPIDRSALKFSDEETNDPEVLSSIIDIILIANQNNVACDFYAAAAYGTGEAKFKVGKDDIVGTMDTREWRIFDNGEYFFDSYGLVVGGHSIKPDGSKGTVSDALVSALSAVLNYTERVYSPDSQTFYTSKKGKTDEKTLTRFPALEAVEYPKPESTKSQVSAYVEKNYYRNDFREFTSDNWDKSIPPITSGLLRYDEEKGIYYLECETNCEDESVLELSIKSMKDSSGADVFKYAKKRLKLEIWECGLIKNYINENIWEATLLPKSLKLKGSSDNFYEQRFTYNKDDLEIMIVPEEVKQNMMK